MSKNPLRTHWYLALVAALLLGGVLGCRWSSPSMATPSDVSTGSAPVITTAEAVPASPPVVDESTAISDLEARIGGVYEAASASVVNITNRSYAISFGRMVVPQEGSGSGFVIDMQGHIVTNYHVIEGAEELLVTLSNGTVYEAEVVGSDAANDLAVIRIDAGADLPAPLALADSDALRVGQFVVAIGNPFGLEQTLTTGVVSALGRVIESPEDDRFIGEVIQTDAAINPGNSGGPLLDLNGQVVGVNSQIVSTSGSSSGIGFAISSNTVARVIPELIARGSYPHPWLGLHLLPLTPSTAAVLREAGIDLPVESGLLVLEVDANAPAGADAIQGGDRVARIGYYQIPLGGDILVAIDGVTVDTYEDLTVYLETEKTVGDMVNLTLIRNGETIAVTVTLSENPEA